MISISTISELVSDYKHTVMYCIDLMGWLMDMYCVYLLRFVLINELCFCNVYVY